MMRVDRVAVLLALTGWLTTGAVAQEPGPAPANQGNAAVEQQLAAVHDRLRSLEDKVDVLLKALGAEVRSGQTVAFGETRVDVLVRSVDTISDQVTQLGQKIDQLQRSGTPPAAPSPSLGRLVLQNWTNQTVTMRVNGRDVPAGPGATALWEPRGWIEAYVVGPEIPRRYDPSYWKWNGQHYEFALDIK